jgi:hypothetical protein
MEAGKGRIDGFRSSAKSNLVMETETIPQCLRCSFAMVDKVQLGFRVGVTLHGQEPFPSCLEFQRKRTRGWSFSAGKAPSYIH